MPNPQPPIPPLPQPTKINQEKFIAFLREKWGTERLCPLCNKGPWSVNDSIFELREFHGGNFVLGGVPIVPVVPVMCTNCGNTVFVNALQSGALSRESQEGK